MTSVVVVGAGIVGAACAYYAARAGLSVVVVDKGGAAGGTTGAGEGNILLSDKEPGPELELALRSRALWAALEVTGFEWEPKGGLVVASSAAELEALSGLVAAQRAAGVVAEQVDPLEHEPHLNPSLAGGFLYPQDAQVQPMLAAARLLAASGADFRPNTTVVGLAPGEVTTTAGVLRADAIVNAAGVWAGSLPGLELPILARRGFILVTGRTAPGLVRHKVYAAGYVADVGSSSEDLQTSPVVEATRAGTILIGASRERVGFDATFSLPVLRALAAGAVRLFPALGQVPVIRVYRGFRPYSPDHLPVIGPDPRLPGLYHATGHEGAGVGLAPATGEAIAALITGAAPAVALHPFSPARFL
ncbi:MAG TPA: FAD-dependent oxidoreductase [Candidatus Limnocylindrales bacterium]